MNGLVGIFEFVLFLILLAAIGNAVVEKLDDVAKSIRESKQ